MNANNEINAARDKKLVRLKAYGRVGADKSERDSISQDTDHLWNAGMNVGQGCSSNRAHHLTEWVSRDDGERTHIRLTPTGYWWATTTEVAEELGMSTEDFIVDPAEGIFNRRAAERRKSRS